MKVSYMRAGFEKQVTKGYVTKTGTKLENSKVLSNWCMFQSEGTEASREPTLLHAISTVRQHLHTTGTDIL